MADEPLRFANCCAPTATVPPVAGTVFRQTMTLPGVYWLLDVPFVQIVGLYSNTAENPGFFSGPVAGAVPKNWLVATLRAAKAAPAGSAPRKALVIATHHPPFSSGGHGLAPVSTASGQVTGDHTFEASDGGYGYLVLRASAGEVRVDYYGVAGATRTARDGVTVPVA